MPRVSLDCCARRNPPAQRANTSSWHRSRVAKLAKLSPPPALRVRRGNARNGLAREVHTAPRRFCKSPRLLLEGQTIATSCSSQRLLVSISLVNEVEAKSHNDQRRHCKPKNFS